jgi:hypothetical protein
MTKKPRKSPKLEPTQTKSPRAIAEPTSDDSANFCWRVHPRYIDYEQAKLGWNKIGLAESVLPIIRKLQDYEGLTWFEVKAKEHCHPWEMHEVPTEFAKRLQERNLDVDAIFQICFGSKPRVFGYKDRKIFYLIWYDYNHEFWPTKPRNS